MNLLLVLGLGSGAQPPSDTIPGRDTTRKAILPAIEVSVSRGAEDRTRLPMAVGVLDSSVIRRAQLAVGLDESLSRLPGVVVLNRYNFSLDQRVSLRGAGSRANFGLRGVKVLIDGVPQTLPDGQSQLSNLDLGLVDRVEVLTGSAGALYGNASAGVLAFTTETPGLPWTARFRVAGGSFGTWKGQSVLAGRRGRARGIASLSHFSTGGFRQHSAARATQFSGKLELDLGGSSTIGLRLALANAPRAEHPGALTTAEYEVTRDSAAGSNILRGADKSVAQQQISVRYRVMAPSGAGLEAILFGLRRDLRNPLATAPAAPPPATSGTGTYSTIDRRVGGVRVSGTVPARVGSQAFRLAAGADFQAMRDDRLNTRSVSGIPVGTSLVDQRETVTEIGPFAQLHWEPDPRVLVLGAVRYDHLVFRVRDRIQSGGLDRGGERTMSHPSGSLGASFVAGPGLTVYANGSTSFESPTTTELVNTTGTQGFNTTLGPQRTRSAEIGVRGRIGTGLEYSLAGFTSWIRDAIIQAREVDGRAYFENAGQVRNRGLEGGLGVTPASWLSFRVAYTFASYRFQEYQIRSGATTDTLDGKRLAGVPRHFFRATLTLRPGPITFELEQTGAGAVYGDDRNTLLIDEWGGGAGITSVRLSGDWGGGGSEAAVRPFASMVNVFDQKYVGSANINGFGGRVLEPAAGRAVYLGMEMGLGKR